MGKIGRNDPCMCGSGKKYKRCCLLEAEKQRAHQRAMTNLAKKLQNGELPFRAEIQSDDGKPASLKVMGATVINESGEQIIFEDEIELTVGEHGPSKAVFEVPIQKDKPGRILTVGGAKVIGTAEFYNFCLASKKLEAKSPNGLFASIKTQRQRDIGADVCHIYFGEKGREESVGADGQKDRPHICLASTGAGLYTRLASYKCTIMSSASYERDSKVMSVDTVSIKVEDWREVLKVSFSVDHSDKSVEIIQANFVPIKNT
ncbi:MAG: SEC-C metal-binding domain-containing protein [Rhodospirillales bacterium]|nr:SEC-C metal-binding domain-containing protein [Rhodospirillales bacterium]